MEARAGHISFISSLVLYFSIVGYAAYAPSKFAVVGFAEILRHELKPYDINVSVLYPPDTDTPGFEKENETKPEETTIISETGKLRNPKKIAQVYAKGLLKNKFHITTIEGKLLFYVSRLAPQLLHTFLDWEHKKARKKLNREF
jgi:3-dehydrosphinganine reductase